MAAVLAIYLLGFGPASTNHPRPGFHRRYLDGAPPPPLWPETLYAPIFWLGDHTLLSGPIQAYERWWLRMMPY